MAGRLSLPTWQAGCVISVPAMSDVRTHDQAHRKRVNALSTGRRSLTAVYRDRVCKSVLPKPLRPSPFDYMQKSQPVVASLSTARPGCPFSSGRVGWAEEAMKPVIPLE
ncbi:unnamed protein product [Protopolystoma xenopodis]|uniref:Uncharacterized protein n=1 Tax=Protopolystoma xenopodis TaxID=117903 RepID=A0A448XP03_9PLAT|nr:unnamed protein product [Protopolystoma xenopodis]